MRTRNIAAVITAVAILMSVPFLTVLTPESSDAAVIDNCDDVIILPDAEIAITEFRQILTDAGYNVDGYSDEELEIVLNSFSNKNLIGKYAWDDPTGVNWLLNKAGVQGTISEITLIGDGIIIVANGASYLLTAELLALGPVGWLASAGVFILSAYTTIMQNKAMEKANVALNLISQKKNYAVYETTVLWNLMPNGYEVEEW